MRAALSTALLMLLVACAQRTEPEAELRRAEQSAVALVNDWARDGSEGRWDELSALHADARGFTWVEEGEIRYADHQAIVAGLERAREAGLVADTTVTDVRATALSSSAAAVRANYSVVFGDVAAGGFAVSGMMTGVAVEQNGHWQFLQGHLSSPRQQRPE